MTSIENNNNLFHRIKNILQNFRVITMIIVMLFAWLIIITIFNTSTPFFVVSSRSMVPVLDIGDIIIVNGRNHYDELEVGDVIVFTLPTDSKRVIVHRVNSINEEGEKGIEIKTKGDNNPKVDGWTVLEKDYIGTVVTSIPSIGKITIWLSPPVNYYIIFFVVLILLTNEVKKK